ncbi:hypothetical protein LIER_42805 [Lithospermum erythrorhizon]|uniref:Uncharacterized protein n=1 Tax=Lithospermum erythrorhizon TaxID=34254 RepID=A0AAV3NYM0_LITER
MVLPDNAFELYGENPFQPSLWNRSGAPHRGLPASIRQIGYNEEKNVERMRQLIDFTDELRDQALCHMQEQKQMMSRFFNRRVKNRQFSIGDLVLRVLEASQPKNRNKLNPKWEGPYPVRRVIGPRT